MTQTKLTLTGLKTLVDNYVDKELQLLGKSEYDLTREEYSGLIVKIGKQLMQDSNFTDRLPELNGEELPYGFDIEEYFIRLGMPEDWDGTGASALAPSDPNFEDAVYTKGLPRKTFKQTLRDNVYEKAMLGQDQASSIASNILKRWTDSRTLYHYAIKRQMLGNMIDHAIVSQNENENLTIYHKHSEPIDTATAESFSKLIKKRVTELATFVRDSNNMGGVEAIAPKLVLYVKGSDIVPTLDVDLKAGAFNVDKVQIPLEIKELEDFGETAHGDDVYAILIDSRIGRLHPHRLNVESERNATGEFTNFLAHEQYTVYISKFVNINVFGTTDLPVVE